MYIDDKYEGPGKEYWKDGTKFEGLFKNGLKNGFGKFEWPDGNSYSGDFVDNKR